MATDSSITTDSQPTQPPQQWRGLDEYLNTPEFREYLEREFPEDASQWSDPVTRRRFLTLMGASLALAGAAGCTPRPAPARKIFPYVTQPVEMTPGLPLFYATAMTLGGVASGLLVRSREGRPIKIEGNPSHPGSLGGTDIFAQAAILGLYDPDRSGTHTFRNAPRSFDSAITEIKKQLDKQEPSKGKGLRILTETITSPSTLALFDELLKRYPEARWIQYDPIGSNTVREGTRQAFGKPLNVVYDFTKANVVLSLDADFLEEGPGHVRYARDFASRRKVRKDSRDGVRPEKMNRLYVVESMLTPTGSMADHRLPIKPSEIESFARALAKELKVEGAPEPGPLSALAKEWVKPLAEDLLANGKNVVVLAGDGHSSALHALCHAINAKLGAIGETVTFTAPLESRPADQLAELKKLTDEMKAGHVEVLLVLGDMNPVFTAPVDLGFALGLEKVKFRVHSGLYQDETAVLCDWHLPAAHFLETWGDARAYDGTITIQQPLIAPLHDGRSILELLSILMNSPEQDGLTIVQAFWKKKHAEEKRSGDFDTFWQESLRTGVVADTR